MTGYKIGTWPELKIDQARELAGELRSKGSLPVTVGQAFRLIKSNEQRLPLARDTDQTLRVFYSTFAYKWLPVLADTKVK